MQKAKWLSEEALQIAEKRIEAKEKEKRKNISIGKQSFQRIDRRDKRDLLSAKE